MNPPYFKTGEPSPNASVAASRHGAAQARECFLDAAFQLLNNGGKLFLIDSADTLADLMTVLRAHRLEPKRMQFLYTKANAPARRVLIEAKKLGRPGLVVEPPDWLQES
ncbi:tRNA1(Val) (adenine(37)-N6)-methyltransferase [bioreactor metagenome]|uniref:tRNA1(Val) (Adenine(37)-N6)-methyltransferase n=1 Tax=bioreactor metagenome TaxID=1076179 RepID=A0A645IID9_9ZZZZ